MMSAKSVAKVREYHCGEGTQGCVIRRQTPRIRQLASAKIHLIWSRIWQQNG